MHAYLYTHVWSHMCEHIYTQHMCRRLIVAVMKHHDQRNLGRKGLILVTLPQDSSSLEEVSTGTQTEQDPGAMQRPWRVLFTGLFSWLCSVHLLRELGTQ